MQVNVSFLFPDYFWHAVLFNSSGQCISIRLAAFQICKRPSSHTSAITSLGVVFLLGNLPVASWIYWPVACDLFQPWLWHAKAMAKRSFSIWEYLHILWVSILCHVIVAALLPSHPWMSKASSPITCSSSDTCISSSFKWAPEAVLYNSNRCFFPIIDYCTGEIHRLWRI